MPEAPTWLSDDARAVWDEIVAAGVDADRDAMAVYCCAVVDFTKAQKTLDEFGNVVRGARGGMIRSPFSAVKSENAQTVITLAREFGLLGKVDDEAPPTRAGWRNAAAAERTITALRSGGRLEDVDAATTALVRHLAAALDGLDATEFPAQTASLARVQLAAIRTLRGGDDDDAHDGSIGELLAALSAPMGDGSEP
jgi:P27 family predicted phage terminase small subunit